MGDLSYACWPFAQGLAGFYNVPCKDHGITSNIKVQLSEGLF